MPANASSSARTASPTPDLALAARVANLDTGTTARTHLSVDGVSLAYPDRRVLTDISFSARAGDRLGLIGENGTGKSTLLRGVAGAQQPDAGTVMLPGSVGLLEQQLPHPDDVTVSRVLDEPSNHLDDASSAYLERVLRDWPGIVIFASHDRTLLDAVATKVLDLDPLPVAARELGDDSADGAGDALTGEDPGSGLGVRLWGVGYSAARAERAEEMRRWRGRFTAEQAERESLEHEISVGSREVNRKHESKPEEKITRKFYADKDARVTARRARNARVRLDALERERLRARSQGETLRLE